MELHLKSPCPSTLSNLGLKIENYANLVKVKYACRTRDGCCLCLDQRRHSLVSGVTLAETYRARPSTPVLSLAGLFCSFGLSPNTACNWQIQKNLCIGCK